jgi:hypothetical protein
MLRVAGTSGAARPRRHRTRYRTRIAGGRGGRAAYFDYLLVKPRIFVRRVGEKPEIVGVIHIRKDIQDRSKARFRTISAATEFRVK